MSLGCIRLSLRFDTFDNEVKVAMGSMAIINSLIYGADVAVGFLDFKKNGPQASEY